MKNNSLPKIPVSGTAARVAIQCICPDTGVQGSFLFTGQSHHARFTRVSPVFNDLYELFKEVGPLGWREVTPGNCAQGYVYESRPSSETMVWDIAGLVARDWYRQASKNPFGKFFLWYRLAKDGERIALPIASIDAPNDEYKQSIAISGAWPVHVATRKITEAMQTLPILGDGK